MKILRHVILGIVSFLALVGTAVLPASGAEKEAPWKFAVLSDTRSQPCEGCWERGVNIDSLNRIAASVADERPDVVLVPGDLALGKSWACGEATSLANQLNKWREAMGPVYKAGIPVLPVRGNHEYMSDDPYSGDGCTAYKPNDAALQAWVRTFGADVPNNGPDGQKVVTFAFAHKNALFVGLDELVNYLSYDSAWLNATVKAGKAQHLFVYGHYPAFGVDHASNLSCNAAARDALWNTIGDNNGRLYFCGHDHFYDRGQIPDAKGNIIQQVLVGNGGAPFTNYTGGYSDPRVVPMKRVLSKLGYVIVTVNGAHVSAELKVIDGGKITTADKFEYTVRK